MTGGIAGRAWRDRRPCPCKIPDNFLGPRLQWVEGAEDVSRIPQPVGQKLSGKTSLVSA